MNDYGYTETQNPDNPNSIPGRVTAVHKERYQLVCRHGACYGRLKTSVYFGAGEEAFPTVGDFVWLEHNPSGDSQLVGTQPRRAFFSRRDPTPGRGEQAVAANFDYVFIMQSLNHDFNPKRLERYLTLAWQSGAAPVVVLTKADLADDPQPQLEAAQQLAPGVGIHAVSAATGQGMEALQEYLRSGKTIVLLGSSGVGKSSLVNALAGGEAMAVSDIREDDSRGRHTTTHRQLLLLPSGAMVIDTPGMRELGMWDVSQGLGEAFADVEDCFARCKFSDCRHQGEPGCGVQAALEAGALSQARWDSYCKLKKEARITDSRQAMLQAKTKRNKAIAQYQRQRKKQGESKNEPKASTGNTTGLPRRGGVDPRRLLGHLPAHL